MKATAVVTRLSERGAVFLGTAQVVHIARNLDIDLLVVKGPAASVQQARPFRYSADVEFTNSTR